MAARRLFWHRSDLRLADNVGLATAAGATDDADDADSDGDDREVLPVFVFDDDVLAHGSPPRVSFMLDALASLRADYRERGGDLLVARGDPAKVLPRLARTHGASGVTWNRDYSGLARERDDRVRAALADAGIAAAAHHDAVCHEPGSITTTDGEHYSVYTYFWKKWRDREKAPPVPVPGADALAAPAAPGDLPTLADLGVADPEASVPPAGTGVARDLLESFLEADVFAYGERRDYPAEDGTSRLSPHLAFGTVGIRELDERVREVRDAAAGADRESVVEFRSQLAWREFYTHVLAFNPDVVTEDFRSYEHDIQWREDPAALRAWKRGETGYPIVDAGMRQLREEAYVHNRVRMIVASFLTKDLLLDWREGYDWYREKLVDHDTANDTGGWQWAASTGTDAQPYFRIFNPMTQGERYDPDAEYIREYVPELREAPAEAIHAWPDLDAERRTAVAPDYPAPIVDHAERREAALAMFERARGTDESEGK